MGGLNRPGRGTMENRIITYLKGLEENNNRDWYHAHKEEYREASEDFERLTGSLMMEIGKEDSSILHHEPRDLTFKLNRDTRFSNDKSPYNPAFRCHMGPQGKLPVPVGYFLFVSPGKSFLGGGLFADMFKDATDRIRDYISRHGEEFRAIIEAPEFQSNFKVEGTSLKNVPKPYEAEHPQAEFLKYKSWYIEFHFEDRMLDNEEDFVAYAAEKFLLMKPFNDFLNKALEGFVMPTR